MPYASKPALGYPSTTAAVEALMAEGLQAKAIAERIGCSLGSVYTYMSQIRKRAGKPEPVMKPGIWTPEKLQKAHRLFGKSMLLIAEALQVPPKELLEYGLKGVLPPMGETQRVGMLVNAMEQAAQADEPVALPAPTDEPSRDDDERELEAIDDDGDEEGGPIIASPRPSSLADEIASHVREPAIIAAPKAVAGRADPMAVPMAAVVKDRVKLRNEAFEYLHENERNLTRVSKFIWRGTPEEARKIKRRKPQFRDLIDEAC